MLVCPPGYDGHVPSVAQMFKTIITTDWERSLLNKLERIRQNMTVGVSRFEIAFKIKDLQLTFV